ncbi:MAG TPA: GNAT family N-acetyltransferase [Gemmatimonadales bacterium]|nr:GNAT family N-acetyltransferase [Gemmatimonadales bacterium]
MPTLVTRTYLELRSPDELRAAPTPQPTPRIERVGECPPSFYRYLYTEVGRAFHWTDRLRWSDDTIRSHLATPGLTLWLLSWDAAPAGYFELKPHDDGSIEIAYFGLLPEYFGRGWGKYLLTEAVREAWRSGPSRVWLHTCTLDHPAALPNYLQRGFTPVREERYTVEA